MRRDRSDMRGPLGMHQTKGHTPSHKHTHTRTHKIRNKQALNQRSPSVLGLIRVLC